MLSLILATTLLVAPDPGLGDSSAELAWQGLTEHYAQADALDLDVHFQLKGDESPYRCEIRLAKGLRGTTRVSRGDELVRFIGNGKGYFVLNEAQQSYMQVPEGYMGTPVVSYLGALSAWATGDLQTPIGLRMIESQPANPLVRVLEAQFDSHTEVLWIGPDNGLLAASVELKMGTVELAGFVTFEKAEALRGINPDDFAGVLPEDFFEVDGTESLLLPTGIEAPFASMRGLDGKEFQLDDLRGKTVLLNFWFYT